MSRGSKTTAFTLVELLVVIGIIAVLISLLLPALGKARDKAMLVKCLSNEKQIYVANLMYVNDNKGWIVNMDWPGSPLQPWYDAPVNADGSTQRVYFDPNESDPKLMQLYGYYLSRYIKIPGQGQSTPYLCPAAIYQFQWIQNQGYNCSYTGTNTTGPYNPSAQQLKVFQLTQMGGAWNSAHLIKPFILDYIYAGNNSAQSTTATQNLWHANQKVPVVMTDGHGFIYTPHAANPKLGQTQVVIPTNGPSYAAMSEQMFDEMAHQGS